MTNNPPKLLTELAALRIMLISKGATGRPADILAETIHRLEQLEAALQAILDNAVLGTGTATGDKYQIDDDVLHTAHTLLHSDNTPTSEPPRGTYRLELWRTNPPSPLPLVRLTTPDDQQPLWQPDPGNPPAGWPTGYQWRLIPNEGSQHTAATWPAAFSEPDTVTPPTDTFPTTREDTP